MQIGMAGISCFLAMPISRDLPPATVMSLLETQDLMHTHNIPFNVNFEVGGSIVTHSRNALIHRFMETDYSRMFCVDSDISWKAADFLKLLALSAKMDVVCGAYPTKSDNPVFFIRTDTPDGIVESNEYGCLPIKGIGLGFTVISRKVIEELCSKAPKRIFPFSKEPVPRVFRLDEEGIEARGEDMAFFADIRELGYPVYLDPAISLGHIGPKTYTASVADFIVNK